MDVVCQGSLRASSLVWRPRPDAWALTIACRALFELAPGESPLIRAPTAPLAGEDDERRLVEPWGPVAPLKRWGEVVVVGHAYAPEGNPVRLLVARLAVGDLDKAVQIRGDACFAHDGALGEPAPFTRMPLRWERAAGGPRTANPVGVPTGDGGLADPWGRVRAPNLLPAGSWGAARRELVRPAGLGPLRPEWPDRAERLRRHAAGWNHARWAERPLPEDIDLGYFNVAPPDQVTDELTGGERIVLEHLHPRFARLVTRLAAPAPRAITAVYGVEQRVPLRCDTLVIDTDHGVAALVWRGQLLLDRPDRAGVVLVTHGEDAPSITGTMAAPLSSRPAAALPFQQAAAPPGAEPPAGAAPDANGARVSPSFPASGPEASISRPSSPASGPVGGEEGAAGTQAPSLAPARPALPFRAGALPPQGGAPVEGPSTLRRPTASPGSPPAPAPPPPLAAIDAQRSDAPPASPQPPAWLASPQPPAWPASPQPPAWLVTPPPPAPPPPAASGAAEAARAEAPAPAPATAEQLPTGQAEAPRLPVSEYPLERCAAIAARLARRPESQDEILEAEALALDTWEALHAHWLDAIRAGMARGSKAQLSAYDAAFVGALEAERGPITAAEYARLVIAAERGNDRETLAELRLPEGVMIRIRRVWLERVVKDPEAAREVREAMREAAEAP
ncbi:DUF2169 domain-containing protein [Sorangium sp. So ce1036]|uniref:DUF2169 family type VI secretion system accessory protein n=1 Tax=Sorangium sp. So ce1036 TaxID=3133328 RepID=UPI003F028897